MKKELTIILVVITFIVIINLITQQYTKSSISALNDNLYKIKDELMKEEIDEQDVQKKIEDNYNLWLKKERVLSYYIEHDELEKIGAHLNLIKGYMETKKYDDSISSIEETIFIYSHIQDKYKIYLKNVF